MSIGIAAIHTRLSSWSSDRDFLFLANQKEDHMNGISGLNQTENKQLCAKGRFVLVAVDENNRPVRLNPSLTCAR